MLRKSGFDELINLFISISPVSTQQQPPYVVVSEKDDPDAYRFLVEAYLKWILEPDPDKNPDKVIQLGKESRNVTFLRDDSIGDPRQPDEDDNIQEISKPEGTDVFYPIYYFHSSIGEADGMGGTCNSPDDCVKAAKYDLSKIRTDKDGNQMIYADISVNGGNARPITANFSNHSVTDPSFDMDVGENRLNREPEFHLKPGAYQGAVVGTFMYLRNFKKGDYVLTFGGEASNFKTRSEYTVHIG